MFAERQEKSIYRSRSTWNTVSTYFFACYSYKILTSSKTIYTWAFSTMMLNIFGILCLRLKPFDEIELNYDGNGKLCKAPTTNISEKICEESEIKYKGDHLLSLCWQIWLWNVDFKGDKNQRCINAWATNLVKWHSVLDIKTLFH